MAVMHPRVAHNYLKDGYYPTDETTLTLIAKQLRFKAGTQRLLDPCCGEGHALAKLAADIDAHPQSALHTYGVELDAGRAESASQCLDTVLRSNAFDTVIGAGSQSLLFLNPPYGDAVSDQIEKQQRDMARLEVQFIQRLLPTLKRDGVLVLVVPFPSLTSALCRYLSLRLREVQVFKASTDRLMQVGEGLPIPPHVTTQAQLEVTPVTEAPFRFEMVWPETAQLQAAFLHHGGL
ncbi:DUF6094 domain-containing protein [Vibrio sp. D173a]|uniref:DUF6094 domain-containing protein n=1 Tax=Vibrio sp. D173a TaxID=2836349 RepID=UPI002553706D|nr:DUF6094 domain-containing protein [Vibrio sp. D173a]